METDDWDWLLQVSKTPWDWLLQVSKTPWDWLLQVSKTPGDWLLQVSKTPWDWLLQVSKTPWDLVVASLQNSLGFGCSKCPPSSQSMRRRIQPDVEDSSVPVPSENRGWRFRQKHEGGRSDVIRQLFIVPSAFRVALSVCLSVSLSLCLSVCKRQRCSMLG